MNTKLKKFLRIISTTIAVIASLLMASCGGREEVPITVPAGALAGELMGMEPCSFENSGVEYTADSGTLVVPQNRSDPDSRLIALPVTRLKAASNTPAEPVFWSLY